MASGHSALLDQLQSQVNLILEQTGRVFAAINSNPKERPTAQVLRLKNALPLATNRFHDALDQLESGLQMTTLVMRRDLAVCRELSGIQITQSEPRQLPLSNGTPAAATNTELASKPGTTIEASEGTATATATEPPLVDEDTAMDDWIQPSKDETLITEPKPEVPSEPQEQLQKEPDAPTAVSSAQAKTPPLADAKPSVAAHSLLTTGDNKSSDGALQVDTKPPFEEDPQADERPADEDKAPDTANDLDSLFNDPLSAEGGDNDFGFDQAGTGDIDFGSFGGGFDANADNDNISSLLPGLEDYAKNTGAEMDFNSLFAVGGDGSNDAMNQQGAGEQRDTAFDDLMDFANIEGMDADANVNSNAPDFDFDALFN